MGLQQRGTVKQERPRNIKQDPRARAIKRLNAQVKKLKPGSGGPDQDHTAQHGALMPACTPALPQAPSPCPHCPFPWVLDPALGRGLSPSAHLEAIARFALAETHFCPLITCPTLPTAPPQATQNEQEARPAPREPLAAALYSHSHHRQPVHSVLVRSALMYLTLD